MFVWDWKKLLFHLVLAQLAAIPRQAAPCTMFKPPFNIIIISIIISIIFIVIIMIIINPTQPQKIRKRKLPEHVSVAGLPQCQQASSPVCLAVRICSTAACFTWARSCIRGNIYVAHHPIPPFQRKYSLDSITPCNTEYGVVGERGRREVGVRKILVPK